MRFAKRTSTARSTARSTTGFTLVELIVVIGIIALLAGVLLPVIVRAIKIAGRTRVAQDLNTIAIALDAYKQDFGDYPRVDVPGTGFAVLGKALGSPFGDGIDPTTGTRDLMDPPAYDASKKYGIGDCVFQTPNNYVCKTLQPGAPTVPADNIAAANADWALYSCLDGADGTGFRIRAGGTIHRPYFESGKLKFQGLAILDHYGNPILYFPQSPVKINLDAGSATSLYVDEAIVTGGPAGYATMYDFDNNGTAFRALTPEGPSQANFTKALARMRVMMGDVTDPSGTLAPDGILSLNQSEKPNVTGPYILWSAGPDGFYGPLTDVTPTTLKPADRTKLASRCDDVMNFTVGQ